MKHSMRIVLSALLVILLGVAIAQAQTGKIRGIVQDEETGDPLPGVNVIVEDTDLGAATNANGEYVIIQIPPGVYNITASFIGYATETITDVRVSVDRTVQLNFELEQTAIAGAEVIIEAQQEVIRPDVSYSQTNMSSQEIDAVPVNFRLDDFLETQVGVEQDAYGLNIRGSGRNEINYMMDGMPLRNERYDQGYDLVSKTAIEEVQLLTGAFNAEYGNARAGIVQVVTKSPGQRFFLNLETRYSPLWGGDDPDYPGLKHFGSYLYSNDNWWEYGRYNWNNGEPAADRDGDGDPDFIGWNEWAAENTFHDATLTPREAFEVWRWQHRSEDENGNVLYNGQKFASLSDYRSQGSTLPDGRATIHRNPFNWYSYRGDMVTDVTLGGPIPFTSGKLGFVISNINENSMYPFPTATSSVYAYNTTHGKITYDFNPSMRLTVGGMYSKVNAFEQDDPYVSDGFEGLNIIGAKLDMDDTDGTFNRDAATVPRDLTTKLLNLKWTHTVGQNTFYELKFQRYQSKVWQVGNERLRNLGQVYQVGPVWLDESPKGWSYRSGDSEDLLGYYGLRGTRESDLSYTRYTHFSGDISSQVTINHQIKAGFEFTIKNVRELYGYSQNMQYFYDREYRLGPDGAFGTADDGTIGDQANWHDAHVDPWLGAFYLQDKMEFGAMILNAGVRVDMHDGGSEWYDHNDIYHPTDNTWWDRHWIRYGDNVKTSGYENYFNLPPDTDPPVEVTVSPRFGISHPIGAQSKIFFNYGHFYDLPPHDFMYRYQVGVDESIENLGNPWLYMPRTIQFEAGWEQSILDQYVARISGYYKDVTRDIEDDLEIHSRDGDDYDYFINGVARDIKGVELELRKPAGLITGFVSGEYHLVASIHHSWEELFNPAHPEFREDPKLTDYLKVVDDPFINERAPGDWRAKVNLALHIPPSWGPGPTFGGAKLLGAWDISVYHKFEQGDPFNWNPRGLERLQGVYNRREKDYHRTDLHFAKRLSFGGTNVQAFLDISNLFNVKNLAISPGSFDDALSEQDSDEERERRINYMDAVEAEGKKFGAEVDDSSVMPQRLYYFWDVPRDFWFGIQLIF